jgi:hypothetical protein
MAQLNPHYHENSKNALGSARQGNAKNYFHFFSANQPQAVVEPANTYHNRGIFRNFPRKKLKTAT